MIVVAIQARMGSSRLPKKVLMPLGVTTVIDHVIARCGEIDAGETALLTTTDAVDDVLVRRVESYYNYETTHPPLVTIYRGHSVNVLDRYYQFVQAWNRLTPLYPIDTIVRITGDCPIFDPELVNSLISLYNRGGYDYCSLVGWPDGLDAEVFSVGALTRAWNEATLPSEQEHVTPYIWKNKDKFKVGHLSPSFPVDISHFRWCVDEQADLDLVRRMVDDLGDNFGVMAALGWSFTHPELASGNAHIKRNEGYARSLMDDANDK